MEAIWNDIVASFERYGPNVLYAILILVGFIIAAYIVRWIIAKAVDATGFAKKANAESRKDVKSLGSSLATAAFWVIILVGVVQALTQLGLNQVTDPLNGMLQEIFDYLPRIIGAILIFSIFAIVAGIVHKAVKAVLVFADPVPKRVGLADADVDISGITAIVLSSIVLIFGGIAALEALQITAISEPAIEMLQEILTFIPNVVAAVLLLTIFVVIARFTAALIERTLPATGLNTAISQLGLLKGASPSLTASKIVANLAMFFIILLGLIAALRALNMEAVTNAMYVVLDMGASIVFGAVIIFAGVFIANLVTNAMDSAGSGSSDVTAKIVKWIIIILAVILGVSRMGLDPQNGAFVLDAARILLIGAAVGLALAFGLGGREWAARQLEKWRT